jgi:hypothetical protein
MNENKLENSSLELYDTAYKLHYIEGNIPEAIKIYKAIIDEFPDSNECGYAVIQIQKIQANDVAGKIRSGGSLSFLSIVSVACAVICVVIMAISLASIGKIRSELERFQKAESIVVGEIKSLSEEKARLKAQEKADSIKMQQASSSAAEASFKPEKNTAVSEPAPVVTPSVKKVRPVRPVSSRSAKKPVQTDSISFF